MSQRSPELQNFLNAFAEKAGISAAIVEASDHPGSCRCVVCLQWWAEMPPEDEGELQENGRHGPFTWGEIWHFQDEHGMNRTEGFEYDDEDAEPLPEEWRGEENI